MIYHFSPGRRGKWRLAFRARKGAAPFVSTYVERC